MRDEVASAGEHGSVLVVDDDPDIVEMLSLILDESGYEALSAHNGKEALEQLCRGARPGLILLDLMMPVMSGWEFRSEQLREPELAELPVVILTGDGRAEEKAASLDASGYLAKPVELDTLLQAVEHHHA